MDQLRWLPLVIVAMTLTPADSVAQAPPPELRVSGLTVAEADLLRTEVARLAAERRVSVRALSAIAERLGTAQTSPDIGSLLRLIDERATELQALQDRLSALARTDDPAVTDRISRARAAIDAGDLASADRLLAEAAQSDLAAIAIAETQTNSRRTRAAETMAERGGLAALQSAYGDSATFYAHAADTAPTSDVAARWRYRMRQGEALRTLGETVGDTARLREAVTIYRTQALPLATQSDRPSDWAETQNDLGLTLVRLAERGDAGTLSLGIVAFESALTIRTRASNPEGWARTQMNLGAAFYISGSRGDDVALRRSIQAFEDALAVLNRETDGSAWALTKMNLGNALLVLGQRGDRSALSGSLLAFRDAIAVVSPERDPTTWIDLRINSANALTALGEQGNRDALLLGIDTFDDVLRIVTPERDPARWAMVQGNLGNALRILGDTGDRNALLRSVRAFESALTVITRERNPVGWAVVQANLGTALSSLGALGDDDAVGGSITALEQALTVQTRASDPAGWASTQNSLGNSYEIQGDRAVTRGRSAARSYDLAIQHFRSALEVYSPDRAPAYNAGIQRNIDRVTSKRTRAH